jgi:hypothetical protein
MPLLMDTHRFEGEMPSDEEIRKAHAADLAEQDRHGVRYLRYWVSNRPLSDLDPRCVKHRSARPGACSAQAVTSARSIVIAAHATIDPRHSSHLEPTIRDRARTLEHAATTDPGVLADAGSRRQVPVERVMSALN